MEKRKGNKELQEKQKAIMKCYITSLRLVQVEQVGESPHSFHSWRFVSQARQRRYSESERWLIVRLPNVYASNFSLVLYKDNALFLL